MGNLYQVNNECNSQKPKPGIKYSAPRKIEKRVTDKRRVRILDKAGWWFVIYVTHRILRPNLHGTLIICLLCMVDIQAFFFFFF